MHRVVVIDNYDSFTYNLVQALEQLGARCEVALNDAITAAAVLAMRPDGILVSPGPCSPDQAGASLAIIAAAAGKIPLLGVCLGHQALAQTFGARVVRAARAMHGKTSPIEHDGRSLFRGLRQGFSAMRYHSLIVERASVPRGLEISAWTAEGEIMGLRHRELALEGVQFHPESFLTDEGARLLGNWLHQLSPAREITFDATREPARAHGLA
jgi:anthranilate synthase/aminodeoxychorismate synthase-like glutamine amidotransferase